MLKCAAPIVLGVLLGWLVQQLGTAGVLKRDTAQVALVTWDDITFVESWNEEEAPYLRRVVTVGFLVSRTDSTVVLATSRDLHTGTWHEFNVFPAGAVVHIEEIEQRAARED